MTKKAFLAKHFKILRRLYPGLKAVYGPYTNSKDGRRRVVLYTGHSTSAKQYAKVKVEIRLGRRLTSRETVDHRDENYLNDKYSNLQILTRPKNAAKSAWRADYGTAKCVNCDRRFTLSKDQVGKRGRKNAGPFCSKHCTGKYCRAMQLGTARFKRNKIGNTRYHRA